MYGIVVLSILTGLSDPKEKFDAVSLECFFLKYMLGDSIKFY